MRRFLFLLLLASGCRSTADRAPEVWYDQAEMVCYQEACEACRGAGHVGCKPCRAAGQVRCRSCSRGVQSCRRCKGDGSYKGEPCKRCRGRGKFACPTCGGDALIECRVCSGKGRVHCLRAIPITEPKPSGEDVWPPPTNP